MDWQQRQRVLLELDAAFAAPSTSSTTATGALPSSSWVGTATPASRSQGQDDDSVYSELAPDTAPRGPGGGKSAEELIGGLFLRTVRGASAEERLRGKMVMLDNTRSQTEQGKQEARLRRQLLRKRPRLGKEGRKELRIEMLSSRQQSGSGRSSYEDYLPLHACWQDYMEGILRTETEKQRGGGIAQRVLMADLHGCILTVTESKCGSDVGLSGIVVRESRSAFHLVTTSGGGKVKIVPKDGRIFVTDLGSGRRITLHGNGLMDRQLAMASPMVATASASKRWLTNTMLGQKQK